MIRKFASFVTVCPIVRPNHFSAFDQVSWNSIFSVTRPTKYLQMLHVTWKLKQSKFASFYKHR